MTAKAKASRMGKGKGALDCLFLLIHPGARLLVLPSIQLLALIRLLRSIRIRLPFTLTYLDSEEW